MSRSGVAQGYSSKDKKDAWNKFCKKSSSKHALEKVFMGTCPQKSYDTIKRKLQTELKKKKKREEDKSKPSRSSSSRSSSIKRKKPPSSRSSSSRSSSSRSSSSKTGKKKKVRK